MSSSGRFVWYELATTDADRAKAFYNAVVGWNTADISTPGSGYTLFMAGDTPVAGLTNLPAEAVTMGSTPEWRGYVRVDNVDAFSIRAVELGGTIRVPPTDVPNVSRFCVVADPQGAMLALVKGRESGMRSALKPGAPGHIGWHELVAPESEKAFGFYSALLGWQKSNSSPDPFGTYQEFSDGTDPIGGVFTKSGSPLAFWLFYFNVEDVVAAAKAAEAHGGKIHYGPIAAARGTRIVHCSDPQGALFGLLDRHVRLEIACYAPRDVRGGPSR